MCQIDDELTINEGALLMSAEIESEFRLYLDGLLALPSETERVLKEMEREKANEMP